MIRRPFLPVVFACAMAALASCGGGGTPEARIVETMDRMEEAAEAAERGAFMAHVHDDFRGQGGALTREDFRGWLLLQLNRHQRMRAQRFPAEVRLLNAEEAVAEFNVLVTGGRGLLPEEGRLLAVSTVWRRDGDDWLLLEADWTPVGQ